MTKEMLYQDQIFWISLVVRWIQKSTCHAGDALDPLSGKISAMDQLSLCVMTTEARHLERVPHRKTSHSNEKPTYSNEELPALSKVEKARQVQQTKTQCNQIINTITTGASWRSYW